MSVVESNPQTVVDRPRLWWRLVLVATGLYVLLLASNYFLMWLTGTALIWAALEILLVALAVFAAVKDLAAFRPRRPLRRTERTALISAFVLVLLWLVGFLLLTWAAPEGEAGVLDLLIGLIVAIPVLPVAALALPGTIVFRRARKA